MDVGKSTPKQIATSVLWILVSFLFSAWTGSLLLDNGMVEVDREDITIIILKNRAGISFQEQAIEENAGVLSLYTQPSQENNAYTRKDTTCSPY